jgi:glycosyltransferase involved in cell wall biosynthesis
MKNPKISVVMSTYNRAKDYLPKAIESVLKQTFKDFEFIIVDDGSTDNTSKVVHSYKDKRIRYYKLKHFGCDTKPKNSGTKNAKGKYIAYLDDDCQFRPDHLQALLKEMERPGNEEIVMVYGDRWVNFADGKRKGEIGIYQNFDQASLLKKNYIDTSDVLVKKEAVMKVGGWNEDMQKFIDWNLWVRMAKYGYTFVRLPVIITDYTVHEDMKSVRIQEGQFNKETGFFKPTFDPINCRINVGFIGKQKKPRVAIFTLCKNRLDYTKRMYESMSKTAGYPFDWYVVDNGSTDGTAKWLDSIHDERQIYIQRNKKNMGIPYASNQIIDVIKEGKYDFIMKADNDVLFKSFDWLDTMMKIYSVMRPFNLSLYPEGLSANAGGVHRYAYTSIIGVFLGFVSHLGGMTSMVPAEVYDKFKWPNASFLRGGNDVLLSSWLNKNSYQLAYMENFQAEHMDTTEGQKKKYPEYFKLMKKESVTRTEDYLKTGKMYEGKRQVKVKVK